MYVCAIVHAQSVVVFVFTLESVGLYRCVILQYHTTEHLYRALINKNKPCTRARLLAQADGV